MITRTLAHGRSVGGLGMTWVLDLTLAVLAGRLRPLLTGGRRGHIRNRITGALLMETGEAMALARR